MKIQILFDVLFGTVLIAFIHFLIVLFTPGPMPQEVIDILNWFTK